MMKRNRFLLVAATAFLAACAGGSVPMAEPAPAPEPTHVDPTGEWEVAFVVEGQPVEGIMTITGSRESGYQGYIDTAMGGAAITVQVDLDRVRIVAAEAGAEVSAVMTDDGVMEGQLSGGIGNGTFWASRVSRN